MSAGHKLAILGGGAWGTALACVSARAGHITMLWTRDSSRRSAINATRCNTDALPGITLPQGLNATTDLADCVDGADIILVVVPAQTVDQLLTQAASLIEPGSTLVLCAKGMDQQSGRRMSEIVGAHLPKNKIAVLSGPSFAADVAAHLPTAVTVGASAISVADQVASTLSIPAFRCYASDDLVGVEIGGALKNVMALAVGMATGLDLGASARAALTTRGFAEVRAIAVAMGARPETLYGLSGLGDLILSCGSAQSRNFAYGQALSSGQDLATMKLAEGVHTAGVAAQLARQYDVAVPIIFSVDAILSAQSTVEEAMHALLSRPLRRE